MLLSELTQEVSSIHGVGPALAARLQRLGVTAVRDLLLLLPRSYEDRSRVVPLAEAARQEKASVEVTVVGTSDIGWGRSRTLKATVADSTGREASLLCFGRAFLRRTLVTGAKFFVWGSFHVRRGELQCSDFELEPWSEHPAGFGRILPVYPLTEGLTQAALRRLIGRVLEQTADTIEPALPPEVLSAENLPVPADALKGVHFPRTREEADRCRAALAYEELFYFEVSVLRRKRALVASRPRVRDRAPELRDSLVGRLPFALTADQLTAVSEIEADLLSAVPMARLLQGDVGCGKTLVAFLSALLVIGAREQAAFLAPTELLARQHAETAARLLEPLGVRIAFLSGSVTGEARGLLLEALKDGRIDLLFGTHALFSEGVAFRDLGLVIVDEQHRFGVLQRQALLRKGTSPDLLLMTATPIPRTLALTAFGDLDVTSIRTMPAGRRPVITHLAREGNEEKVYRRVREEIDQGRQAYFVYPLIEESEALDVKDAETAFRRLQQEVYPGIPMALIHSRVLEEEKEAAMAKFASGAVRILVATSVVEVGVDVANATCMVVEHAERFGLSTLHQLRGRVGRGESQSYAFLVYGQKLTPEGVQRLKIMMETTDGFAIAESDMRLRGPGELLGVRQSGFLNFRVADLALHGPLLFKARDDAKKLLDTDPGFLQPAHRVADRALAAAEPPAEGG
ncbi:MAG TPA: ATP-dependent DNA helicase RecG [Spirochaetia bacterium]|nr:ATP-dependent DNA helicase RecG [Spirochaetia bacterium]